MNERIDNDKERQRLKEELRTFKRNYKAALKELRRHEKLAEIAKQCKVGTHLIKPRKGGQGSEATAFAVASDWHVDEVVKPKMVNGLNRYNQEIARARADRFFRNTLSLLQICQRDVTVDTLVLALLGDFISGNIHEELLENTSMTPMEAIVFVQDLLASGIKFLCAHSKVKLVVVCHVGNHSRITRRIHISSETGNSLETLMYCGLRDHFRALNDKRVEFLISPGYHSYLDVYGWVVRFHHGHSIRYQGGVGGIYIPVNKAIAQWNKLRWADLDVFGHFHQRRDGGNFICNGSNIGYNPFALSIKADFEKPQQTFFLIDRERGKTITAPIILEEVKKKEEE